MSFIARQNAKRRPKVVNRSSLLFRIKSLFKRRKARILNPRVVSVRPETPVLKRKINLVKRINPKIIRILIATGAFAFISMIIVAAVTLFRDPYYSVKYFDIIGNNSVTTDNLYINLDQFLGRSMFLIGTGEIKKVIQENYINLQAVNVIKIYPDKIFINITEREPRIILVNINGAYLVDEEAYVINVLTQSKTNYDQERLDLASGFADESSPLIRAIFLANFIQERGIANLTKTEQDAIIEREYNFEDVPTSKKVAEYNKLKTEIQNDLDALTGEIIRKIQTSEFSHLPEIILLNNQMYSNNDLIDKKRLDLTLELIKYFSNPQSGPTITGHIYWKGEMLVQVNLSNGTSVIFGVLKKASYQLEDYEIIVHYLSMNNKKYSQIDLSSTKISVK